MCKPQKDKVFEIALARSLWVSASHQSCETTLQVFLLLREFRTMKIYQKSAVPDDEGSFRDLTTGDGTTGRRFGYHEQGIGQ